MRSRLQLVHLSGAISKDVDKNGISAHITNNFGEDADGLAPRRNSQRLQIAKKVAIVDDEESLIPIYEHVIKSLGYGEEFVGSDGVDIVEAVLSGDVRPDVIIMDYRMPRMNGLDAAGKIREVDRSIRIILSTADDSVLQMAREMGLQTIQKPFSISQLKEVLRGPR